MGFLWLMSWFVITSGQMMRFYYEVLGQKMGPGAASGISPVWLFTNVLQEVFTMCRGFQDLGLFSVVIILIILANIILNSPKNISLTLGSHWGKVLDIIVENKLIRRKQVDLECWLCSGFPSSLETKTTFRLIFDIWMSLDNLILILVHSVVLPDIMPVSTVVDTGTI